MTGGIVALGQSVWSQFAGGSPLPPWLFYLVAIAYLLAATYRAWLDENRIVTKLADALTPKLVFLWKPDAEPFLHQQSMITKDGDFDTFRDFLVGISHAAWLPDGKPTSSLRELLSVLEHLTVGRISYDRTDTPAED